MSHEFQMVCVRHFALIWWFSGWVVKLEIMFCDTHKLQLAVDKVSVGSVVRVHDSVFHHVPAEYYVWKVMVVCHSHVPSSCWLCWSVAPQGACGHQVYSRCTLVWLQLTSWDCEDTCVACQCSLQSNEGKQPFGNGCRACFYVHIAQAKTIGLLSNPSFCFSKLDQIHISSSSMSVGSISGDTEQSS